ncbi:hypothetical protein [Gloeocapsopsis crepidinum]|uniref:hypothetical protein n=1 Tax=Gloeocapsopsis crepidinum TaxID=693223 RepID=UPI00223F0737|nr:hypothetical protein [Gloeocapsopsis crepidinum]
MSSPSRVRCAAITTFAPTLAKAIAVALPIPELPPVTIATFPFAEIHTVVLNLRNRILKFVPDVCAVLSKSCSLIILQNMVR